MRWRPTIEAVIAGATLVGCTAAHACLDDGTLVDTRSFKLAAQVPSAVQVEQRGQFVWLEAGKGNEYLRYSLPNDRTGMEVIYFEPPATAGSIELCVHTTFLHQAAGDKPAITFIDNAATLPSTQRARLQRFSEAARLWGQATASSQQQAFALLSELAADGGDDPQRILQWSRLAAARAALSLPNPRTTLALLEKYGAGLGGDTLFAVAAKKLQGLAELHLNDFPAAETSFHAALALSPGQADRADIENWLGETLLGMNRVEEGKAHIEAALTLAGDDHAALAHIHNNMGYVLLKQAYAGNRSSAEIETQLLASINEHLIARAFAQSAHEMDELQGIENNLGSLYERVGELRNASQHYRESLKLIDPAPNPYGARVIYWNLGNLSQKLGDYLKARSYVEAAKTLVPANEANVAQLYDCMLGRNYRLMADYDKAIAIHRQCRQSAMQAGKTTQQLEALADLADDYVALARQQTLHADNGSAAANLQQAWQLISEAKVLLTAGNKEAGARVDKTAAANACEMDTANDNDAQGGAHNETDIKLSTKILSRHAQLAGIIGEIAQARTSLAQAAISANSASYPEQIEFLSAAIAVYRAAGDRAAMLRCGERALAHVEALHADLAADRNGAAWSARTHEIYVTLADMLLDAGLAQDEPSATAYQQQALAIVERSRAINLRQQLAMPRVADVASREQQKLRTNLDKIAADSAAAKDMSEVLPTAYYHQYDLLELARLENVKKVPVPPPLSLREIQQRLDAKQRVLYYFIAEQDCYLFEITARTFSVHRLGSTAELQSLLDPVVASDKTPSAFPLAALRKLGHFLLPATLATANAAELVIVPHRGLDTLPFAALQLPGTDDYEPLVNRFAIKEVPSLSAYFMKKPAHSVANRKDIAVFADPVFARDDLATADADAMTDGFRSSELQQDAFRNWTGKLERLPYTGIEAKNLVMAFDKGKVLEFTGERATLDNLVSPAVRAARILHIATHGYFHSTSSDNVGLVLSAVDEHHNEVANFVTLSELLGHNFDNELVVISGCDTAMGLELNGEGMFGLTRGFLAQGAGQVISTLWPVSDRASAEFMKLLYGHLLETRNVAQALQQAQRDLSRNPAYRSPYYWAGYVLSSVTADPVIGVGR